MLRKKLNSQSGVSILMAMLLFLVCAVVGTLVLTAATAAVGRKVTTEQTDQQYYSIDSAAGLLRELITDGSVAVQWTQTQVKEYTDTLAQTNDATNRITDTDPLVNDPTYAEPTFTLPSAVTAVAGSNDLLILAVKEMIPGWDDASENYGFDNVSFPDVVSTETDGIQIASFSLSAPDDLLEGKDTSFLSVDIGMKVDKNGNLVFTIVSEDYVMKETFRTVYVGSDLSVTEREGTHMVESTTVTNPAANTEYFTDAYTVTTTTVKKGTFQWEFVSCSAD